MPAPATAAEVVVVLLAAGLSRRFGAAKQLQPWRGKPLVRHMAETALACRAGRLVVVEGAFGDAVAAALAGLPLELVHNPDYAQGQSTSVRRGIAAAGGENGGAAAILFLPVDMPFLEAATLDLLIGAWEGEGPDATAGAGRRPAAVVPTYGGQRGAPVLFDRRLFGELAVLEGDRGGRAILPRHPREVLELPIADPRQGRDLDTREDLLAACGEAL